MNDDKYFGLAALIGIAITVVLNLWLLCYYSQFFTGQWWEMPVLVTHAAVALCMWLIICALVWNWLQKD